MQQRGFTLIELMVTIAIASLLLSLALTSFNTMMASSQVRSTAESIVSGLRMARAEAIKRNVPMRFQFVSALDNTCGYATNSGLWIVTQTDAFPSTRGLVAGYCGAAPYIPPDQPDICTPAVALCTGGTTSGCRGNPSNNLNPATCSNDPLIAFKSSSSLSNTVNVASNAAVVTFSPLGRVITNADAANATSMSFVTIGSTNTSAKTWRVQIRAGSGSILMCDPNAASTDALYCPP